MPVLTTELRDRILVLTINRPERRNAWNQDLVHHFRASWEMFARDDAALVCVVRANGSAFSAGIDFKDPPSSDFGAMPNTICPTNKPIIVAVEGACLGMACSLVMMSDIAVAGESASFAYLEAKVGVHGGLMAGFPGRMLFKPALQWILTCEAVSARRASEFGLIGEVVADGAAFDRAMAIAQMISDRAPLAVTSMKAIAMQSVPKGPIEQSMIVAGMVEEMRSSDDFKEGLAALREGRPPKFKGA